MGRTVLITGSTRGIGYETAICFLRNSDNVIIFCRHKRDADEAVKRLKVFGSEKGVLGIGGDVRKAADVTRIVRECLRNYSRIDVLVNNAGVGVYKPLEETTEEDWDNVLDTNLKGTFLFLREVVPVMKKQGSGVIINISSGLGVEGMAGFSAYCASKFAVVGLTKVVADELTLYDNIRIYGVLPGAVDTTLLANSGLELDPAEVMNAGYVAGKIFDISTGRRKSGSLIEVYS